MKRKISTIFVLFSLNIVCCYAQTTLITGNVKDRQGENVSAVSLVLKQTSDSTIVSYMYSDTNGNYILSYAGDDAHLLIAVSGLGIATQIKKIENKSQTVNFIVEEAEIQLKEVVIKSQKIYYNKDTINYLVSAFSDAKDIVIGDVLKKMPGIDVAESGQISYQGRAINKFYIENMDLLNGRYGIATQNIAAKDVSTVQVMENHQPIKAMDSLRISDRAAINLKLKEGAKGTLSMMAQLGIGASPLLWNNELTAMYFTKKNQNISTYKTNNTGHDLSKELHSFNTSLDLTSGYVTNIQTPSPPDIDKDRYLFNNTHAVTSNNLVSIGKDKELNLNVIYYNDHEKRESEAISSYFITGDSLLKMNEVIKSSMNTDRLETEIRYNENSETRYVNDFLNLEGSWNSGNGTIWNEERIDQGMNHPSFKIINALHFIKRTEDKGLEINSQTGFQTSPQNLTVSPGLYAGLLNDNVNYADLRQDARSNTFVSNNNLSFPTPYLLGKVVINPALGLDIEMNSLVSELYPRDDRNQPLTAVRDSMRNDISRNHYKPYAGFYVRYSIRKFNLNASIPVSYNIYQLKNKNYPANNEHINELYFEPSLDMRYVFSPKITFNSNIRFYQNRNGIDELYSGYILQTYRYLNHYDGQLAGFRGNSQSVSIAYKDILKMFFASANLLHAYNKNSVTHTQRFENNLLISSLTNQANASNTNLVTGKISKGFDWIKLTTDVNLAYRTHSSQQFRQDRLVDYQANQFTASIRLSAVPVSFIIVSYKGTRQYSRSIVAEGEPFSPIRSMTNTLNFDFTIIKALRLGTQIEQYANSAIQNNKSLYFADLHLNYVWKQVNFELGWNNIFDTNSYVTAYYDNLNEYHSDYRIRPASVLFKMKFKLK
ncbi:MAG: carboxypeptidase-like regulatory domain-containing protein [Candidatus Symbiothrix sp.]|jgi:hypothetical protein|nr:carboxypeptidase-like regulatory domain-containing protein [Candidatus Symbiothrix sp.]